jgi:hypothetical protein
LTDTESNGGTFYQRVATMLKATSFRVAGKDIYCFLWLDQKNMIKEDIDSSVEAAFINHNLFTKAAYHGGIRVGGSLYDLG